MAKLRAAAMVAATFTASISHIKRLLLTLEARLIPREGGGGTIINTYRPLLSSTTDYLTFTQPFRARPQVFITSRKRAREGLGAIASTPSRARSG